MKQGVIEQWILFRDQEDYAEVKTLRKMVRETRIDKSSLIYPLFVKEGQGIEEEIPSMEGQYRYTCGSSGPYELQERLQNAGVTSVYAFWNSGM